MAAMGLTEPLDTWLKGQKEVAPEQYLPPVWGNVNFKGSVIGLPLYTFVRPLYYNVAMFREAGLMQGDAPVVAETWQDWARMARQLTQPSKGIWGTQLYNYVGEDGTTAWVNYVIQAGGQPDQRRAHQVHLQFPRGRRGHPVPGGPHREGPRLPRPGRQQPGRRAQAGHVERGGERKVQQLPQEHARPAVRPDRGAPATRTVASSRAARGST